MSPSGNPFWYPSPQPSSISMPQTSSDRWHGKLAHGVHTHVLSQDSISQLPTPSEGDWSQATFTYDTSKGAQVSSLNDSSSPQSINWPMTEKYSSTPMDKHASRCPRATLWKMILLPTAIIVFPMAALVAGLLGLIFGYRVKSDDSLFAAVSNSEALNNHAVVLVRFSATRIAFVASWASTLAPLLATFVMNLSSFQSALAMFHASSGTEQRDLPTPYQYSLLLGLCLAEVGRLKRYFSYSRTDGIVIPPVLRRAARTMTITLVLAMVVFGADTALHYTTSTINFDQVSTVSDSEVNTHGRGLSKECLTLNRTENFGLPCSRNGDLAASDYFAYVQGQNEISFLEHNLSNTSEVSLVSAPNQPSTSVHGNAVILLPQTANVSPYQDYRATTAAVVTTCTPITSECEWKTLGPQDLYSQFNCTNNFYGILGMPPNITQAGNMLDDSNVPTLGFKPSSTLQYSFFMDQDFDTPYDSTGVNGPALSDSQLINPVYLGVAARFTASAQRAGVNMSGDPGVHQGPTPYIDFVLRCQYTTYEADYNFVNSTASITSLTPSPNGTLAEIFHGFNIAGTYAAFDNDLQDDLLQSALQTDPQSMADDFANFYSIRVMSVIGPFLSGRANLQEQVRTSLLVAKVPKAPLAILVAGCIAYIIFGIVSAVLAYRALNEVDVRDVAFRFSLPALGLQAFRDVVTENTATEVDATGHRVFDESKIRSETSRVAVEGEPTNGFVLKSLV
ncbi:hypothetical protein LTR10_019022 [Elasticomyces elasticus]|uniref:Uncharacterized protein n=1 Tax=Exophiala sideris TaxID=1016849 RepID=A0ABR0J3D7_9EURO|nr:hypothetical protein LTR10_019022 [Elasticomyces elasticus]KAK5026612.1 hypothetical protein LTS07_007546 [Exophiala sideris]KAK5033648.1 hypothetical protein LTR13_006700 [Exophiala sideris]KAK5055471.1 hypothetical protein LTR69_008304 [Exophiala sideris]KAK5176443.1 hypothetical protein LTR44_011004 [Eurotiomycetes sp. CCFEE 6388]